MEMAYACKNSFSHTILLKDYWLVFWKCIATYSCPKTPNNFLKAVIWPTREDGHNDQYWQIWQDAWLKRVLIPCWFVFFLLLVVPGFTSIARQKERNTLPVGKGANDLAQLAFMTSKLSEITTEPSAPIPQKIFTPSSAPCPPYIHKEIQSLTYKWQKYPPKSISDLVVVLKINLAEHIAFSLFWKQKHSSNKRKWLSIILKHLVYGLLSKFFEKLRFSHTVNKQGFEKFYAKSHIFSLESEENLPVQQKQFQPWYHRPQTQSFHQDPWGPHGPGMGHGHGESGRPQSQTLPR